MCMFVHVCIYLVYKLLVIIFCILTFFSSFFLVKGLYRPYICINDSRVLLPKFYTNNLQL